MQHWTNTHTTPMTRALCAFLALVLLTFGATACEREEKCQCTQLFPEDTDPEEVCEDCICPADTILLGLGPKGVQNEVDCVDDDNCGEDFECREGKCVNVEENNPNRFHACVKASGVLDGRYMLWDKDQKVRVECGYRDGKRHEYCDVYDGSENRLHHCIYQDGEFDSTFSVGVCKASCTPTPSSIQFQVIGTNSTDIYPIYGCNANGVPLAPDTEEEETTDADVSTDDAATDEDVVETDATETDATDDDVTETDATDDDVTTEDASTEDTSTEDTSTDDTSTDTSTEEDTSTDTGSD